MSKGNENRDHRVMVWPACGRASEQVKSAALSLHTLLEAMPDSLRQTDDAKCLRMAITRLDRVSAKLETLPPRLLSAVPRYERRRVLEMANELCEDIKDPRDKPWLAPALVSHIQRQFEGSDIEHVTKDQIRRVLDEVFFTQQVDAGFDVTRVYPRNKEEG